MAECLFQGSFNPIHNGHIEAAKYVYNKFHFDRIVFIPAFIPPHKDLKDFSTTNALHRLNMVQLAVEDYPFFTVSAIEYMRNKPSYTYDTVTQIYDIIKPKEKINFIIGTDAFINIESWHRADELKNLIDFILFVREENFNEEPYKILKEKGYNYKLADKPFLNISATEIRERLKQNKEICDTVPIKVAEYIKNNNVYGI